MYQHVRQLLFVFIVVHGLATILSEEVPTFGNSNACWNAWGAAMAEREPRSVLLKYHSDKGDSVINAVRSNEYIHNKSAKNIKKKSVLLVHVGKTCGSSVDTALWDCFSIQLL
jgi:hypothetical protein